ncbi:MAG: Tim44/TimA family putative adaptor protein [Rhodospirillaceae bacterium]|nr:Tim44/TimA family putative adaptor protein [Rhodospirillaceae bacterium]MBT6136861.1 Tim44/TimA family putative adaptor protein [Rhodospirillaceae bacterium]
MGEGFAFLDIIVFAMIAGFLILRLRGVLGRRTGHEPRRGDPFQQEADDDAENDNVIALPDRDDDQQANGEDAENDDSLSGMMQLKTADPSFDEREFLGGAKSAFEMIVFSFAAGDRDTLLPLLGDDLGAGFEAAIDEREAAGETQETRVAFVKSADVMDVTMKGSQAHVTVEFVSDQVKATRDAAGELIDGDPDRIETITDLWTFARDTHSGDPNWQLVATRSPEE